MLVFQVFVKRLTSEMNDRGITVSKSTLWRGKLTSALIFIE